MSEELREVRSQLALLIEETGKGRIVSEELREVRNQLGVIVPRLHLLAEDDMRIRIIADAIDAAEKELKNILCESTSKSRQQSELMRWP